MKTKTLKGVSALALLFGASQLGTAVAQQAPAPNQTVTTNTTAGPQTAPQSAAAVDQSAPANQPADKVVITGSLIATTPEDAPKPVEVYSAEDLKQQGTPNVTEFIRSLTVSYGDDLGFGQASPDVPEGTGFGNANLRGLGSNATLALMNGRPLAPWNGAFGADINTVPMDALQAVEVLKGGASATYGAGAVGGVLNFRTRRDIDAPQISIEKQFYDGSDGYWKGSFLTGWVGDAGNLMVSLSHSHEDQMLMDQRDFSSVDYKVNAGGALYASPTHTLVGANPGAFQVGTTNFYTQTGLVTVPTTLINDYRTAADCTAVGGYIVSTLQTNNTSTACGMKLAPFQSLVNENTQNQAYAEFNANISDSMEVHFDINWSSSVSQEARLPIDAASAQAIDRSASTTTRTGMTGCTGCNYVLPVQVQNYSTTGTPLGTFVRNPFINDLMTRTGLNSTTLPDTGAIYLGSAGWRPFMYGGNPMFEDGRRHNRFERDSFAITAQITGEFPEDNLLGPLLNGVHYDFSGQYNQYLNTYFQGDLFVSRLQNALNGYGGPNCNAIDRVPTDYTSAATYNRTVGIQSSTPAGTGGCQWFNPFASAWATSIVNGAANPQFNSGTPTLAANATPRPTGYQNPKDLIDWMWNDKKAEYQLQSATFNFVLSSTIPENWLKLPGGEIGWAAGVNWRQVEGRRMNGETDNQVEEDMATQFCAWPDRAVVNSPAQVEPGTGTPGCTTAGAFFGTGRLSIVGATVPPFYYDNQNLALFAEVSLPILDNVSLQWSGRHEEWNGGSLKGDIYSVAGKWDITDNLWVRSDYGTNYRADAALELQPGATIYSTSNQTRFGAATQIQHATIVAPGIKPEDDKTFNFGFGWQSELGEGRIRASVQFFEALIDGQVSTTSATTIYNNVFGLNTAACQANRADSSSCSTSGAEIATGLPGTGISNGTQFANCSARLISFIQFVTPCVQGVTTSVNILETDLFQLNGSGFITNGIDYSVDYAHPLFDGTFSAQLTATQNLVYKSRGYDVNGILFEASGHRLGYANYTRTGNESRRWRANGQVRWANDVHNISLRANFSSGVYNEAFPIGGLNPIGITPNTYSGWGVDFKSYLDFDLNYVYTAPFWKELELRATVLNLFDKDPTQAAGRTGYYTATGNPRGRIIELGVSKKF
jgi:outer membrane receptor protein involved in Fe transport